MKVAAFRVKAPADDLLMPLLVSNCSPGIVIICSVCSVNRCIIVFFLLKARQCTLFFENLQRKWVMYFGAERRVLIKTLFYRIQIASERYSTDITLHAAPAFQAAYNSTSTVCIPTAAGTMRAAYYFRQQR